MFYQENDFNMLCVLRAVFGYVQFPGLKDAVDFCVHVSELTGVASRFDRASSVKIIIKWKKIVADDFAQAAQASLIVVASRTLNLIVIDGKSYHTDSRVRGNGGNGKSKATTSIQHLATRHRGEVKALP